MSGFDILGFGQSNMSLAYSSGANAAITANAATQLGITGTLLGGDQISAFGGSAMIPPSTLPTWLTFDPSNRDAPFAPGPNLQTLIAYLEALPADVKARPTAILWMKNETDSINAAITPPLWQAMVSYTLGQIRAALGQTAATTPVVFIDVPYEFGGLTPLDPILSAGALRRGFASLAAGPTMNATIGPFMGDSAMNGYTGDGQHFGPTDLQRYAARLSATVTGLLLPDAASGAPASRAPASGAAIDTTGPSVASYTLGGTLAANQLLVTLALPSGASGLQPLSASASTGMGWTLQEGLLPVAASSASLIGTDQVLLTFGALAAIPTDGSATLYYGEGTGLVGVGAGIYDSNAMPLQPNANGLGIAGSGVTITGTAPAIVGDTTGLSTSRFGPNVTISASTADLTVSGGGGAAGIAGEEVFYGELGRTQFNGGAYADVMANLGGASGSVFIGAQTLRASITGGLGAVGSALVGGTGQTTILGGGGDTIVAVGGANKIYVLNDKPSVASIYTGGGTDTVQAAGSPLQVLVQNGSASTILGGTAPSTVFGAGSTGTVLLYAGSGATTVVAGAGATDVNGSGGPITVFLAAGAGTAASVSGNGSATTVVQDGTQSPAVCAAGAGSLVLFASGAASVDASSGPTTIIASPGSNLLLGGTGANAGTIFAGTGVQIAGGSPHGDVVAIGAAAQVRLADLGPDTIYAGDGASVSAGGALGAATLVLGGAASLQMADASGSAALFAGPGAADVTVGGALALTAMFGDGGTALMRLAAGGDVMLGDFRAGVIAEVTADATGALQLRQISAGVAVATPLPGVLDLTGPAGERIEFRGLTN